MGMLHGDRTNAPHGQYEKANFNSSPSYDNDNDEDNVVESFSNKESSEDRKYFNMNLLLKSLLFGCLFYLLLDMKKPIIKMLSFKLNNDNQLCVLGTIYVVLHYLISLII